MAENADFIDSKAENILEKIKEEVKSRVNEKDPEPTFRMIDKCSEIINLYSENRKSEPNDILSEAWYYKALLTGRREHIRRDRQEYGTLSLAEGKAHEWGHDRLGALELRLIMLFYMENAVKCASTINQKYKCRALLIEYYLFTAKYFLIKVNDLSKSIELCDKARKHLYVIETDNITEIPLDKINEILDLFNSNELREIIIMKYGNAGIINVDDNIRKMNKCLQIKFKQTTDAKVKYDYPDNIEFEPMMPKIENFYRELLRKRVESIDIQENPNANINENEYLNMGLSFLKKAFNVIETGEERELNEAQITSYANSNEAIAFLNLILDDGIKDDKKGRSLALNRYNAKAYFLRSIAHFYSREFNRAKYDYEKYEKYRINYHFDIHYYGDFRYYNNIDCVHDIINYTKVIKDNNKNGLVDKNDTIYNKRGLARAFLATDIKNFFEEYSEFEYYKKENSDILEELDGCQDLKAEMDFYSAIQINPKGGNGYRNLGLLYNALARKLALIGFVQSDVYKYYNFAAKNYHKSIKINPETVTYYYLANCYDKTQRYRKAVKYYIKAIKLGKKKNNIFAEIYINLGQCYAKFNKNKQAIEAYEKSIAIIDTSRDKYIIKSVLYNNLACVYLEEKNFKMAIYYYEEAIKQSPRYIDAIGGLASVYGIISNYLKSIDYYSQAIKLSKYYEDLNRHREDKSKNEYEKYLLDKYLGRGRQDESLYASYLLNRAKSYYLTGKTKLAVNDLNECLEYAYKIRDNKSIHSYEYSIDIKKLTRIIEEAELILPLFKSGKYNINAKELLNDFI